MSPPTFLGIPLSPLLPRSSMHLLLLKTTPRWARPSAMRGRQGYWVIGNVAMPWRPKRSCSNTRLRRHCWTPVCPATPASTSYGRCGGICHATGPQECSRWKFSDFCCLLLFAPCSLMLAARRFDGHANHDLAATTQGQPANDVHPPGSALPTLSCNCLYIALCQLDHLSILASRARRGAKPYCGCSLGEEKIKPLAPIGPVRPVGNTLTIDTVSRGGLPLTSRLVECSRAFFSARGQRLGCRRHLPANHGRAQMSSGGRVASRCQNLTTGHFRHVMRGSPPPQIPPLGGMRSK